MEEEASVLGQDLEGMLQRVVTLFDGVMAPTRALGWWVALDYRAGGHSIIYANRFGSLNRKYTELPFPGVTPLEVYARWFARCAAHLECAASNFSITLLTEGALLGNQYFGDAADLPATLPG